MKPKFHRFLILASSAMLTAPSLQAATLTWDANAATAGQTDGAGAWLGTDQWWNALTSANATWTSTDSAIFGNGGAGGAVSLASPTTVGSLTFNYFTGTYTLGSATQTITLNNGITKNAAPGTVAFASPLILGAAQTWTINASTVQPTGVQTLNNGGFNLTIDGTGLFSCVAGGGNTLTISGAGGIIKNGTGSITLDNNPTVTHTFGGDITVNGGSIGFQTAAVLSGKNTKLTNGYLGGRFGSGFTWSGGLGTGANQIQITGGTSGFSGEGGTGSQFQIGGSLSTLTWGDASFNPAVLLANGDARMNVDGKGALRNAIDLNGANRTITSLQSTNGAATSGFSIYGAISNGTGTAGLTKTGPGNLILNGANTYNGATSIMGGSITLSSVNTPAPVVAVVGSINSTSALNLGGGSLRLVNTAQVNRFADGAAITSSGGGSISYENTSGANVYTETMGSASLTGGQFNVALATDQVGAGSQTLTLGGLAQSGTAAATFSAAVTGPQAAANKNMIVVTGAGSTTVGQIVGPWATTGTAANAQTDYAVYNSDYVVPAAIAGSAETTWTVATDPYTMNISSAGTTLTATRNIGALRIIGGTPLTSVDSATDTITLTGHTFADGAAVVFGPGAPGGLTVGTTYFVVSAAIDTFKVSTTVGGAAVNLTSAGTAPTVVLASATTLALSTGNNLGTNGILNGSPYAISITPGTGGSVTLPTTSAGQLHVNTGSGAITISAPVTDNTGALTLVKNGSAATLVLNGANTFTGNTSINAGMLQLGTNATANGAKLNGGSYAGDIFIGAGATFSVQTDANQTLSGVISGDGNLTKAYTGSLTLSGANTYTGKTSVAPISSQGAGILSVSSLNSVFTDVGLGTVHSASSSLGAPTTVANGTIDVGAGTQRAAHFKYTGGGEITDRVINFVFNGNGADKTIETSGTASTLLKFTSTPTGSGSVNNNIVLTGSSNGEFVGGLPFAFANLTKNGAGTWTLGGSIGNTGTTTVSAGTLIINGNQPSGGAVAVNGTSTLGGSGTVSGAVTVAAGANLAPGSSAGTLTMKSTLNISASAGGTGKLIFELGPISASDKIAVGGALTIGAGTLNFADFNFTALSGLQNGTYKLISSGAAVSGTLDSTLANLTGTVGAGSGTLQISGGGTGNDIELVVSGITGGANYAAWASLNSAGPNLGDDHDNDGVDNGTEYFMFGPAGNSTGFTVLPSVVDNAGTLSVTWPKAAGYTGTYGTHYTVETSDSLIGAWTTEITDPNPGFTVTFPTATEVKYTFPNPLGTKKFARLKVTGP